MSDQSDIETRIYPTPEDRLALLERIAAVARDFCQQMREQGYVHKFLPAEYDSLEEALKLLP